MNARRLRDILDSYELSEPWLRSLRIQQPQRAHSNLLSIAKTGISLDLLEVMVGQLEECLPKCADGDMALNNLDRAIAKTRSPLSVAAMFDRDPTALSILIQLFSTSQNFAELIIHHLEYFDELRITGSTSPRPEKLLAQLRREVNALQESDAISLTIRRFCQFHQLRIGYADIIRNAPLEIVTEQLSHLADVIVQVSLDVALKRVTERHGKPLHLDQQPTQFSVLAMGKLGGMELNYSSDIDLLFLYDKDGRTEGPHHISNHEFFDRVGRELIKLLSDHTELGQAYRVDLRLRPEGSDGPLTRSFASTCHYYDVMGQTWERQAMIKIRTIAGSQQLGQTFIRRLEPWIYKRYLGFTEINEIRSLKRRIEHRTHKQGESLLEVKTGIGGIRDIEFAIQFLQLLNGGDLKNIRCGNTLDAIEQLQKSGCLTDQEHHILIDGYRFLRKVEHRLQIMFGLQTHRLPTSDEELTKLAIRMIPDEKLPDFAAMEIPQASSEFRHIYQHKTQLNRKILDHLLHEAFTEDPSLEPEVDLIFQPAPDIETINSTLGQFPFKNPEDAYHRFALLAQETVPFLGPQRCKHFLASIMPGLLRALSATPNPDLTLLNLEKVSASIGGRTILWELFSFNPATMDLFIELCASSQFLIDILIQHPGMIDDLMDSLVLNQLRTIEDLRTELASLCHKAEDPKPILHSFNNKEILRIGVRDILGKDSIEDTTRSLSDLAEVILIQIAEQEYQTLQERWGYPTVSDESCSLRQCPWCLLVLGKFGGRELTYHSDLDVIFLYDSDGTTHPKHPRDSSTTNFHFFSELAQRITRSCSQLSIYGKLYEIDLRLRPTGQSGSVCVPLNEFQNYHQRNGELWERQALTKARCIYGDNAFQKKVEKSLFDICYAAPWNDELTDEIYTMRKRLEESRSDRNIKRGKGGLVDVEFIVQMLQLKYGHLSQKLRVSNTLEILNVLGHQKHLTLEQVQHLEQGYRFLRTVEARLRMQHNIVQNDLPEDEDSLEQLAKQLGYPTNNDATGAPHNTMERQTDLEKQPNPQTEDVTNKSVIESAATVFLRKYSHHRIQIRSLFLELFRQHGATPT